MVPDRSKVVLCLFVAVMATAAVPAFGEDVEAERRKLIAFVAPSLVTIEVPGVGAGTGFIISADGVIATCYHVVAGAKEVRVTLNDGKPVEVVGVVAAAMGKDIVLLRVKSADELLPLRMARERAVPGEATFTFGAGLASSVSDGGVVALRNGLELRQALRQSGDGDIYIETLHYDLDAVWIQTTSHVSHANRGGPIINLNGEVIGINAWERANGENLNFAIDVRFVQRLLDDASEPPFPLSALPATNNAAAVKVAGDGPKTLSYWQRLNEAKQERADAMARIKTLPPKASSKQQAKMLYENAKAWRQYFEAVKASSVDGVDSELVALATVDAQLSEQLTNAMKATKGLFDANKVKEANTQFSTSFSQIGGPLVKVQERYDFLRIALAARYKLDFPAMRPNSALVQDDQERKEQEDKERAAASSLRMGKSFLSDHDDERRDTAKRWLEKVVSTYPDTAAAKEARALLDKMKSGDRLR